LKTTARPKHDAQTETRSLIMFGGAFSDQCPGAIDSI